MIPNAKRESNGSGIVRSAKISSRKKLSPVNIAITYNRLNCRRYATKLKGSVKNNNPTINPYKYMGILKLNLSK